ncbi:hypothetical protein KEM55_000957, partial [Ascosphaera atra]
MSQTSLLRAKVTKVAFSSLGFKGGGFAGVVPSSLAGGWAGVTGVDSEDEPDLSDDARSDALGTGREEEVMKWRIRRPFKD